MTSTVRACLKVRMDKSGQAANHKAGHGEEDPATGAAGCLLVVAHQAAVTHEPAEGALDDPALGQDAESARRVASFDDLHDQLGMLLLDPLGEGGAAEPAVGPELAQAPVPREHRLEQGLGPGALRGVGRQQGDVQDQAQRIHAQEALATLRLLAGVVTHLAPVSIGAHRLAVDDGGTGPCPLANAGAHPQTQLLVEDRQKPVATPAPEVVIDRLPRGKGPRQQPPLAAGFGEVEQGVDDLPQRGARTAQCLRGRQHRLQLGPLGIGQIGLEGVFHRLISAPRRIDRRLPAAMSMQISFLQHDSYNTSAARTSPHVTLNSLFRQALRPVPADEPRIEKAVAAATNAVALEMVRVLDGGSIRLTVEVDEPSGYIVLLCQCPPPGLTGTRRYFRVWTADKPRRDVPIREKSGLEEQVLSLLSRLAMEPWAPESKMDTRMAGLLPKEYLRE